jgi:RNA polymerase sigma-70 factor (ECF subfamily)
VFLCGILWSVESAKPASGIREAERQWADLIRRIAQGDADALRGLYEGTSRYVYGLAFRIVQDPGAAEEVTLDVYTQVWKRAADYDAARGTPSAWLLTIVRTRAIDRLRSSSRKVISLQEPLETADRIPDSSPSPEESSVMDARRRMVQSALAELPPEQREAVELAYFYGLSQSEIAARTGQPLGTVKTRLRLSMMRLREKLQAI